MNEFGRDRFYPKVKVEEFWERDYLYNPINKVSYSIQRSQIYKVKQEDLSAPDLIAKNVYGTEYLWWYLCLVNGIIDPFEELYVGLNLIVPDINDVYTFFNTYRVNE